MIVPASMQAARELAALQARHAGRWDIWIVETVAGPTWWCARPTGARFAVHQETAPDHLDAWLRRVSALTGAGVTLHWHPGVTITATATWPGPAGAEAAYGPGPVPDVLDHAETALAARDGKEAPAP
jgi:hypothetical protein